MLSYFSGTESHDRRSSLARHSSPLRNGGVVIAGTGLIAATPVAAPAPAAPAVIDVALTGLPGIVDTWQDVFNTASANATTLLNNYMLAPGVAWQQLFANWMGYTQQFLTTRAAARWPTSTPRSRTAG